MKLHSRRHAAWLIAVLFSVASANALPMLTQAEQDEITLALLQEKDVPGDDFSTNFDLYLSVRGADPSPDLLRKLKDKRYLPYSALKNAQPSHIGSGHIALRIDVGSFFLTAPNIAKGDIHMLCGKVCGNIKSAVMEKVNGRWNVRSLKVTMVF